MVGEMSRTVTTTAAIALLAVPRIGRRIAGDSWLMLSMPENASHAPAKPVSPARASRWRICFACSTSNDHWSGWKWIAATPMTTRFTVIAATAM